jgi:hypothetical protein
MRGEHGVVLSVANIEIIVIQGWDLSQLDFDYMYPLRYVCGDQSVLIVPWDVVMINHSSQMRDVIW